MTLTCENRILKANQGRDQQCLCGYLEISLADSRLDITEKTDMALEFVQRRNRAIWSQRSDSDYYGASPLWACDSEQLCVLFKGENNLECSISHQKVKGVYLSNEEKKIKFSHWSEVIQRENYCILGKMQQKYKIIVLLH